MPVSQTSTSLGSITSAAAGSTIAAGGPALQRKSPVVTITTSVTGDATLTIEGRNRKGVGNVATDWKELLRVPVTNVLGTVAVYPLEALCNDLGCPLPDDIRIKGVAYTAGTHTGALLTHTT